MKIKMELPKIPVDLPVLNEEMYSLRSKGEYRMGSVEDMILDNVEAVKVSLEKMTFKNVTILESSLPESEWTDVIFDKCDLSNVHFSGSFIHRVEFRNCKLLGTDFSRSRLQNVRFSDCLGDYSMFRFANFKQVGFEDCSLISADLYHLTLQKTFFNRCNLDQAMLSGSKLKGIDLSDCEFDGLQVDIEDLNGCIISPHQASSFVGLLGLVIK
ncbi:pentapeptide repeat-containing protein [Paenibacillus polymyxa]|uniref:pentapeptide repeat-containing protein n=1 Tax=Paenibacillus polymyxa TaxID=1406 RepID=UPI002AB55E66|nr:pentapeptide repeat-containing protein [Paenibacillus polymyxa]MDY7991285.1 pentapeptide repeat-containing protein [Paenibacillus polymyxa]MDY8117725.1 pentapeptide repeat-containing protein [Paenibacillus polymyxa]